MIDSISYVTVILFVVVIFVSLAKQIKYTISIWKKKNMAISKNSLIGNYLKIIGLSGFLVSYILNVLAYIGFFKSSLITITNTAILCLIFLLITVLSRILSRNETHIFWTRAFEKRFFKSHSKISQSLSDSIK